MLRIHLLGELTIDLDGHTLPLPASGRARSLLAWLAVNPGVHPRTRVAGVFWPDVLESSARASLRTTLTAVRSSLGAAAASCLVATREQVGLDGPELWVDVRAFEQLAAGGRLEDAVALRRGDLLAGLDDDWAYDARDVHRQRLARVLGRLAEAAEEEGDLETAVARTREQLVLEPLSEETHRSLIRRLSASGDRAQALESYRRLRERLRRDLGVPPSPETRELAEQIERGGRVSATPARRQARDDALPLPAPLARPEPVSLVGRSRELDRLLDLWRRASTDEGRFVLLAGEAGTGKTRLASELARRVHATGAMVLLGRCHEEQLVPYEPFAEAVGQLAASETGLALLRESPGGAELVHLEPALGARLPELPLPVAGDPEGARYRLHEAVASLLEAATARPVLLVVEDLHWAARPSLLMLAHVLRRAADAPLLVIGTYREGEAAVPGPLRDLLGELRRARVLERVQLDGLETAEVATLISFWLGSEAPGGLAAAVQRMTGGNPLFVEELGRHLAESGPAPTGPAEWARAIDHAGIPQGVADVIGRRLSRLGEPAQRVLSIGAALGDDFSFAEVEAVAELAEEELVDALDEAVETRLLRDNPGTPGRYAFTHALVRETVTARLSATRRALLHRRIAVALEGLYGDRLQEHLGELARHTAAALPAGDLERAAGYALAAAERAMEQLAYEEAAAHAERALHALGGAGGETPSLGELLLALGEAELRAGERDAARETFARAAAEGRRGGSPELLARAALGHAGLGVTLLSVREDSVALLEEALEALPERESPLRARVLARLAVELYYAPTPDRRVALSEEAVASARRTGDRAALLEALNARRVVLWDPDHLPERLALSEELVELAREAGDREKELQGLNWQVVDLLEAADLTGALGAMDAHETLAEELRLPAYRWYGPAWGEAVAELQGSFSDAERLAEETRAIAREWQDENLEIFLDGARVFLRFEQGRLTDPDLELVAARAAASPAPATWHAWLAILNSELDRPELTREALERFPARELASLPRDANLLGCLASLAWAVTRVGDTPRAAELYDLLLPYAGHCIVEGRAFGSEGGVSFYLALLATQLERFEPAEHHLDDARELHERLGARPWLARTRLAQAQLLAARGEPGDAARARELRSEAAGLADELGMESLAARAQDGLPP